MLKKYNKKSRLFYEYLLSYFSIMLIPMAILCVFVYYNVFDVLKEEIVQNNLNTLERAKVNIDSQIKRLTSTDHYVYLDSVLGGYLLVEDPMKAIATRAELKRGIQSNPFISDMAYYQANDPYMMSSRTSCPANRFFTQVYQYENWNYELFLKDLEDHDRGFFLSASDVKLADGGSKSLVTYVLPLKGKAVTRCVLYFIEESFFTDLMVSPEQSGGISLIMNQQGEVIAKTGDESLMEFAKLPQKEENRDFPIQDQIKTGGETYLLTAVTSEDNQWWYITLFSNRLIQSKVTTIRLLMTAVCLAACGIGVLFVIYWMKNNFSPIESLNLMSKKILASDKGNEIDNVKSVIEYLRQQNESLTMNAQANIVEVKERFLIKLLSGRYQDDEIIIQRAGLAGIQLDKPSYMAVIVAVPELQSGMERQLEQIYLENAPKYLEVYGCVQLEQRRLLLLIGYDGDCRKEAGYYLLHASSVSKDTLHIRCVAGMGRNADKLTEIAGSFQQALKAAEYRIVLGREAVIPYEDVNEKDKVDIRVSVTQLNRMIHDKNIQGVEDALEAMKEEILVSRPTAAQVRRICYELVWSVGNIIEDLNQDKFMEKPIYCNIVDQIHYDSLEELAEIIRIIADDIIRCLTEKEEGTVIDEMLAFIQENGCSCDFSTTVMAEHFKMSLPYLSQYFKQQVGTNLLDYVTDLKMKKAKELLQTTDLPLSEIAVAVGYYNVNSFSRRFKQMIGKTPGDYRKQNN